MFLAFLLFFLNVTSKTSVFLFFTFELKMNKSTAILLSLPIDCRRQLSVAPLLRFCLFLFFFWKIKILFTKFCRHKNWHCFVLFNLQCNVQTQHLHKIKNKNEKKMTVSACETCAWQKVAAVVVFEGRKERMKCPNRI